MNFLSLPQKARIRESFDAYFASAAKDAGVEPLTNLTHAFGGVALISHLGALLGALGGLGHQRTNFMDGPRQWFLHVHMFAGVQGEHRGGGM